MYLGYEKVIVEAAVQTADDLDIPGDATHAELQSETEHVRYTMDNETNPNQTTGMLLLTTEHPKQFVIDDIKRIRFCRNADGTNAILHIHYFGGRVI